ncbi:MAG: type I-E CRISPR-associated protein Cas6/Cse3/CasE [Methanomassiliicoccales archaeon]|nr:MAG: type I-E CRISPR-associated protein Cas6/Cse3/CasE [Methanomassiliicoccales archaeon]
MKLFFSQLCLNPRCMQVLKEMDNRYELHRTLMKAFPEAEKGGPGRVLFRVEGTGKFGECSILIQSEKCPNWNKITVPDDYFSIPPRFKEVELYFNKGEKYRYRILANPTIKRNGTRLGIIDDSEQSNWLKRKAENGGFEVISELHTPMGFIRGQKGEKPITLSFYGVQFDGILRVREPQTFMATLKSGVGTAKGLGFGLLSLARVNGKV